MPLIRLFASVDASRGGFLQIGHVAKDAVAWVVNRDTAEEAPHHIQQ
jgi:hypothetical protein